jgi:hypothetical protein
LSTWEPVGKLLISELFQKLAWVIVEKLLETTIKLRVALPKHFSSAKEQAGSPIQADFHFQFHGRFAAAVLGIV